jgi:hypothetical protein
VLARHGGSHQSSSEDEEEVVDEAQQLNQSLLTSEALRVLAKVPPFVSLDPHYVVITAPPAKTEEELSVLLKTFCWTDKRLAKKFEDGWSTGSHRRAAKEFEVLEGYHLFYHKDDGATRLHLLNLDGYGVTKKWVIIECKATAPTSNEDNAGTTNPYARTQYTNCRC